MKTILIAEDDANIREGLVDLFESEGYRTLAAPDGDAALKLFSDETTDLVLLDVMMPGKSGYDVCREIRKTDAVTPVIMLTAKGEEIDKVVGLQLGADDYITKPFGVHELLARTEAVLRRSSRHNGVAEAKPAEFEFGDARINTKNYTAELEGAVHSLTSREMELLWHFYTRSGEVLSRNHLLDKIWGVNYLGTTRTLDQHISQLRKKVEVDPASPSALVTIHGVGYRYCATDNRS